MTKESKFDVMWMKNLIAYVDYIKTNYRFPSSQTIYQEHKIGYWIRNQISAKKRGGLTKERERMLNCLMPVWNKSQKEKQRTSIPSSDRLGNAGGTRKAFSFKGKRI